LVAWVCLGVGGFQDLLSGQQVPAPTGDVLRASFDARLDAVSQPLLPVLKWTRQEIATVEKDVADYTATLVARERIGGKLSDYERTLVKVRHRPLSIYACVLVPEDHKGDEAIYVEGRNDGKLLGHTTGITGRLVGTVSLDPSGATAMEGQRHPITELGILALCRRFGRLVEGDPAGAEPRVRFLPGVKVNGRVCTLVEVAHPAPCPKTQVQMLRLFVDDELKLPIRYEQYDWPKEAAAPAELVEEYTFLDLKPNSGLTDADFDVRNPGYAFP
jgi:hypothetical protein